MNLTTRQREEFEALSQYIYGASSRYQTILRNGLKMPVTEDGEEEVPNENGEGFTKKTIKIPVLHAGQQLYHIKRFSVEELKEFLLGIQAQKQAIEKELERLRAEQKKEQDNQKMLQEVQQNAAGSAIR